jgi:hypothetical protein
MVKLFSSVQADYLLKFWVGLMDGDGSIQINHWRKTYLQYRLIIKLKYDPENLNMLNLIQAQLGGRVRLVGGSFVSKYPVPCLHPAILSDSALQDMPPCMQASSSSPIQDAFVLWVVDSRQSFLRIIRIFDIYPPQTSRLRAQLRFALRCLEQNNVDWYLVARDSKYLERDTHVSVGHANFFKEWLSGFIEAEGCFRIRKNGSCSFSIGQKNDFFLLDKIRTYFGIQSRIQNLKQDFWLLETYRKDTLLKLVEHVTNYPLLGEKVSSFNKFKEYIK